MARVITFKRSDDCIFFGGQQIRQHNITPELYDVLVAAAPAHADHFDVSEDAPEPVSRRASKENVAS